MHPHWLAFKASVSALDYKGNGLTGPCGGSCTRTRLCLRQVPLLLGYAGKNENGPRGRTCTRTGSLLRRVSLHWTTRGKVNDATQSRRETRMRNDECFNLREFVIRVSLRDCVASFAKRGASGRTCTRNLRVRSAALCLLSYGSFMIKWRKSEGMLPLPSRGTFGFRDRSGALVRFDFHWEKKRSA